MDEKTERIINNLGLFDNASTLKSLQTKLTKTANSILKDGLNNKLTAIYTDKERATLEEAAAILSSIKRRVEHAKEIKVREEKKAEKLYQSRRRAGHAVIEAAFPNPQSTDDYKTTLIWHIVLIQHCREIRTSFYYPGKIADITVDMDRLSEKEKPYIIPQTIKRMVDYWHDDIVKNFKDDLFFYTKDEPYQEMMDIVIDKFNQEWRPAIEKDPEFIPLIERFEAEMSVQETDNVVRVRTVDR